MDCRPYRGTSLTRESYLPRTSIGPQAQVYRRVLGGGCFYERGTPVVLLRVDQPELSELRSHRGRYIYVYIYKEREREKKGVCLCV